MESENSTNALQNLSLVQQSDQLLFHPSADCVSKFTFANVPRDLFRIVTPRADATTDGIWVYSKDVQ